VREYYHYQPAIFEKIEQRREVVACASGCVGSMQTEKSPEHVLAKINATQLQVLREPDRPPTRKSYAYCFRGDAPEKKVVMLEYNAQNHKHYEKLLPMLLNIARNNQTLLKRSLVVF